jgi:hypothetical protein
LRRDHWRCIHFVDVSFGSHRSQLSFLYVQYLSVDICCTRNLLLISPDDTANILSSVALRPSFYQEMPSGVVMLSGDHSRDPLGNLRGMLDNIPY